MLLTRILYNPHIPCYCFRVARPACISYPVGRSKGCSSSWLVQIQTWVQRRALTPQPARRFSFFVCFCIAYSFYLPCCPSSRYQCFIQLPRAFQPLYRSYRDTAQTLFYRAIKWRIQDSIYSSSSGSLNLKTWPKNSILSLDAHR